MARRLDELTDAERTFVVDRHLATLTTLRSDGSPHVVAIAFTVDFDAQIVNVLASDGTQKVVNVERSNRAAVCQVDGPSWLTFEGHTTVARDPDRVAAAVMAHSLRYRQPSENPNRVIIEISVEKVLGGVRS
jgi:PPOX class probable F420-dependent enzyme